MKNHVSRPLWTITRRGVICIIVLTCSICSLTAAQTLLWSDEFDSGSAPDPNIWTAETGDGSQYGIGGWGNAEMQIYTGDASNVMVTNGNLIITAQRDGDDFTSARIKTQDKVTFQYGTVEARIKTPDLADGLWPAFWTLGNLWTQGENWPVCGEIDIMEMGNSAGIANGTVNRYIGSATHRSGPSEYDYLTLPSDINDTFVVYRLEWTPTSITTYVNGQQIFNDDITSKPEFQKPHFLILNLAVGGGYTGITDDPANITATFPAEYVVDYVRIYDNTHTIIGGLYTNSLPVFTSNLIVKADAADYTAYNDTLAGSATDAENDPLTYAKVSGPGWLSVLPDGTLSGTPVIDDHGINSWTVRVSDGINDPVTATLQITVIDTNDDPAFFLGSFSKPNAAEDSPYSNTIAGLASDTDVGDILTYSKVSGPSWLNVAADGALSGIPGDTDVGANIFTVKVEDAALAFDTATLTITVDNVNDAPFFTTDPVIGIDAVENALYLRNIAGSATDVDEGATLTYSKVSGPAWLNVNGNGTTAGVPGPGDVGLNSWTIQVSDGIAAPVSATLEIAVYSVTPPSINIQVSGSNLELRWPTTYTTYSLFGTTNLISPVVWSAVTNTPSIQGDDWMVTMPIDHQTPSYFQLEAP